MIFDFDGVIADSFDVFVEVLQRILKLPDFSESEKNDFRNSSSREVLKKLGISTWRLPLLAFKGRRNIAGIADRIEIFPEMKNVLHQLHDSGYKIFILSTNDRNVISSVLDRYDLSETIDNIYAGAGYLNKSKRLKQLASKEGVEINQCIYIGDETRDIDSASHVGMKCIAVEWGYNFPEVLKSHHPTAMAKKPRDILSLVQTV